MSAVRGYVEVGKALGGYAYDADRHNNIGTATVLREAAALLAEVAATLPDCPRCGGTKWTTDGPTPDDYMPCVACPDGKVTVVQMAALWEAVHDDDDGRDVLSHFSGEYTIDHLRAVRP